MQITTGVLGQRDPRTRNLSPARTTAQLGDQFNQLRAAGGADGMTTRDQTPVRVNGHPPTERGGSRGEELWTLADPAEPKLLVHDQLVR